MHVPRLDYLMIDGRGDPNTCPEYAAAVEALFTVAYTLRFAIKKGPQAIDYGVMPLEGLWWADDMAHFTTGDKSQWQWTMMILQPAFITAALVAEAIAAVQQKKKKKPLPALPLLRFASLEEGSHCAQILHVGPFSTEGPTIEKLHHFIFSQSGKLAGKHHEIYLTDVRRADPANWKTIIRQPFLPTA